MLGEQFGEANRLLAKLLAYELVTARCFVSLVKQQIERLQNAIESPRQLIASGNLERDLRLLDPPFCARQSLCNCRLSRQECVTDFGHAKTAKCFQGQRYLRFYRDHRVGAHEHHSQSIIRDFVLGKNWGFRRSAVAFDLPRDFRCFCTKNFITPDYVEREIARRAHDPRGRIFRNAPIWPGLQSARQRFLNYIFCQSEMFDAEYSRQRSDHRSRLMTEKMFDECRYSL